MMFIEKLTQVRQYIVRNNRLDDALSILRTLDDYPQIKSSLHDIEEDYHRLCDAYGNDLMDPMRQTLYRTLTKRSFDLLCDVERLFWIRQSGMTEAYQAEKATLPDALQMKEMLEQKVQELAMVQLEPSNQQAAKRKEVWDKHQQVTSQLFLQLAFSPHWSPTLAQQVADVILSPTIDTADAQLLTAALGVSVSLTCDATRLLALLRIYRSSPHPSVQQRALLGWFGGLAHFPLALYEDVQEAITETLSHAKTITDIRGMVVQLLYCSRTEEETERINRFIIPQIISASDLIKGDEATPKEQDNIDALLNPDEDEQRMARVEEAMGKMMDMKRQGVDVFFGGFKTMKHFPFFRQASNWLMPFNPEHPMLVEALPSGFPPAKLQEILQNTPFCNSDRYSFALSLSQIFAQMPPSVREALLNGQIQVAMETELDTHSDSYLRRMYIHDLYRFYKLFPGANRLFLPFHMEHVALVLSSVPFSSHKSLADLWRTFIKHHAAEAALIMLQRVEGNDDAARAMGRGMALMRLQRSQEALQAFVEANEMLPNDKRILRRLIPAAMECKQYAVAEKYIKILYEEEPDNDDLGQVLAKCMQYEGKMEEVLPLLYKLNFRLPESTSILRQLAWTQLVTGQMETAVKNMEKICQAQDHDAIDWINLGYTFWAKGQTRKAVELMLRGLRMKKDNERMPNIRRIMQEDRLFFEQYNISEEDKGIMLDILQQQLSNSQDASNAE